MRPAQPVTKLLLRFYQVISSGYCCSGINLLCHGTYLLSSHSKIACMDKHNVLKQGSTYKASCTQLPVSRLLERNCPTPCQLRVKSDWRSSTSQGTGDDVKGMLLARRAFTFGERDVCSISKHARAKEICSRTLFCPTIVSSSTKLWLVNVVEAHKLHVSSRNIKHFLTFCRVTFAEI